VQICAGESLSHRSSVNVESHRSWTRDLTLIVASKGFTSVSRLAKFHRNKRTHKIYHISQRYTNVLLCHSELSQMINTFLHSLPEAGRSSHYQKYQVLQSVHSAHVIVQIHATTCPWVSSIPGLIRWHQSGYNDKTESEHVSVTNDFLRQCFAMGQLSISVNLQNGTETLRDRRHRAQCSSWGVFGSTQDVLYWTTKQQHSNSYLKFHNHSLMATIKSVYIDSFLIHRIHWPHSQSTQTPPVTLKAFHSFTSFRTLRTVQIAWTLIKSPVSTQLSATQLWNFHSTRLDSSSPESGFFVLATIFTPSVLKLAS